MITEFTLAPFVTANPRKRKLYLHKCSHLISSISHPADVKATISENFTNT